MCGDKLFSQAFCEHLWTKEIAHFLNETTLSLNPRRVNVLVLQVQARNMTSKPNRQGSKILNTTWKNRWKSRGWKLLWAHKIPFNSSLHAKSKTRSLRMWVKYNLKTLMTKQYHLELKSCKYRQTKSGMRGKDAIPQFCKVGLQRRLASKQKETWLSAGALREPNHLWSLDLIFITFSKLHHVFFLQITTASAN